MAGTTELRTAEGRVVLVNDGLVSPAPAADIFAAVFQGGLTVSGVPLTRQPTESCPDVTFRYGVQPVSLRARLIVGGRLALTVVAVTPGSTPVVVPGGDDHVLVGSTWFPLDSSALSIAREACLTVAGPDGNASLDAYPLLYRGLPDISIIDEVPVDAIYEGSGRPSTLTVPLYPYQESGFRWLAARARVGYGAILADEMGLGKTIQVVALLAELANDLGRPSLVISPLTVTANWMRELQRFAPALRVHRHWGRQRLGRPALFAPWDVIVTGYDTAVADSGLLALVDWAAVVLDEAQAIKNPGTQRRQALSRLHGRTRVAMTGTPVENRALDLWSLADYVAPGHLGTRTTFDSRLSEEPDMLRRAAHSIMIRREVQEVAHDLPPKIESDVPLEMFGAEAERYADLIDHIRQQGGNTLGALMKLRMFTCHPHLTDASLAAAPIDASMKFARLAELLEQIRDEGKKVVVFAGFRRALDLIAQHATRRLGMAAWTIDGSTHPNLRQPHVDSFTAHREPAVMVLNPVAAGTGLNIQAASHVIHYTLDWNPAREDQATARVWRRGQALPVVVTRLFYLDSIDSLILHKLQKKRELASQVVQPHEAEPSEIAELVRLALSGRAGVMATPENPRAMADQGGTT